MILPSSTENPLGQRPLNYITSRYGMGAHLRPRLGYLADGTAVIPPIVGVPAGTMLTYVGTWQTTATMRDDEIVEAVVGRLNLSGMSVVSKNITDSWYTNVMITPQEFVVTMQIQMLGAFAKTADVVSIIRHSLYEVSGHMPLSDSVPTVNGQSTGQPANPDPNATDWGKWMQDNAGLIGVGVAAVLLGVAFVKR